DDREHALLLDAERRDLREADRLDAAHVRLERRAAALALEQRARAGRELHGVAGEDLHLDLQRGRVAQLEDRRARADDALALAQDLAPAPRAGRASLDLAAVRAAVIVAGVGQRRARGLELVAGHVHGEGRRALRGLGAARARLGLVEQLARRGAALV